VSGKTAIGLIAALLMQAGELTAQRAGFLDHLRIGFGGGANMAHVVDLENYSIYEDLTGASYKNRYTVIARNLGNHYFIQIEWYQKNITAALKPGTYSYHFSKINELVFTDETIEQETPYLLRYFSVPLEARYNLDLKRFRPYVGIGAGYSYLLGSNDASTQTFIRHRFTAAALAGTYVDLRYVILDLNVGYHAGLHNITSKADRFSTGSGSAYAQDDLLLNGLHASLSILFSLQKQKQYGSIECFY
jgi:hypothetical protein